MKATCDGHVSPDLVGMHALIPKPCKKKEHDARVLLYRYAYGDAMPCLSLVLEGRVGLWFLCDVLLRLCLRLRLRLALDDSFALQLLVYVLRAAVEPERGWEAAVRRRSVLFEIRLPRVALLVHAHVDPFPALKAIVQKFLPLLATLIAGATSSWLRISSSRVTNRWSLLARRRLDLVHRVCEDNNVANVWEGFLTAAVSDGKAAVDEDVHVSGGEGVGDGTGGFVDAADRVDVCKGGILCFGDVVNGEAEASGVAGAGILDLRELDDSPNEADIVALFDVVRCFGEAWLLLRRLACCCERCFCQVP